MRAARSANKKSKVENDWKGFNVSDSVSMIEVHLRKSESAEKGKVSKRDIGRLCHSRVNIRRP